MKYSLLHHLEQLATDRWARRGVRTLIRAAWLGACIWCIGLGGHLLWSWPLRMEVLGALSLAVIGAAVLLLLRPKLSSGAAARRLDRRFQLDEQLATAVEVAASNPPPGSIAARLVAQSGQTAGLLRRRISRRQRPPWSEVLTLAALVLAAVGMYILVGIDQPALDDAASPLPPLASAQDPTQQFPQEPPEQREQQVLVPGQDSQGQTGDTASKPGGAGDPSTLEALADAMRDQGSTRAAAEALDHGDIAGAAQELRRLADQAGQLSQSARGDLADRLRSAAKKIRPDNPALADQLRRNADGLARGDADAAQALDDLAREIEQLGNGQSTATADQQGQQGQQQGQDGQNGQQGQGGQQGQQGNQQGQGGGGAGTGNSAAGEQRQAAQHQRLGVEGQPVPLEASGQGQVPAEPSDRPPTTSDVVPGFTRGDASSGERVQTGDDPLRVPLDERDVVQEYFTP